jgi:hypothetical protein
MNPTKDALIERVYEDVYLSRWNPEWEQMLHQPDRSLKARLSDFYSAYLHSIYHYDWVRINCQVLRMGWIPMSGRELQRIKVLSEVRARRRTEISAAAILGVRR